jgi:hypothetical protein
MPGPASSTLADNNRVDKEKNNERGSAHHKPTDRRGAALHLVLIIAAHIYMPGCRSGMGIHNVS